jgi:hypothetical protein
MVCLLISLPATVVDLEFAEVSNNNYCLQTPGITFKSLPEEITINLQGEVPVLLLPGSEMIIYDANLISIPLLEFSNNVWNYLLSGNKQVSILNTIAKDTTNAKLAGAADLFCLIKQSDSKLYNYKC